MLPNFLIPETVIREAGTGPEMSVGSAERGLLLLTLGITRIIEQQSLDIALYGSADNVEWSAKPLISRSLQKFYCGTHQLLLIQVASGDEISPGEMASQPLGPGRPEAALRPLPVRAGMFATSEPPSLKAAK